MFSYSFDEEHFHGQFETREDAIAEAVSESAELGKWFQVGRCVPPTQPENWWSPSDWLEHVSCQDSYGGDYAEDWDESTAEQREELQREVRAVMAAWLDRHELRPRFYLVDQIQDYVVENGVARLETAGAKTSK
jgi:hypothetical protein